MASREQSVDVSSIAEMQCLRSVCRASSLSARKAPRPSCLCAVLWFIHPLPSLHWFQYSPGIFIYFPAL